MGQMKWDDDSDVKWVKIRKHTGDDFGVKLNLGQKGSILGVGGAGGRRWSTRVKKCFKYFRT